MKINLKELKRFEVLERSLYNNRIEKMIKKYNEDLSDASVCFALVQIILDESRLSVRYEA